MTSAAIAIRRIQDRPEAEDILAKWMSAEWPEYHRGRSLPDVASNFNLVPDLDRTLIAEIDGEVVGTVGLHGPWDAAPEIPPPWIERLFVVPQYRGQGIGKALLQAAIESAAEEGSATVHLSIRVDPDSYLSRGWRKVATVSAGAENVTILRMETGA